MAQARTFFCTLKDNCSGVVFAWYDFFGSRHFHKQKWWWKLRNDGFCCEGLILHHPIWPNQRSCLWTVRDLEATIFQTGFHIYLPYHFFFLLKKFNLEKTWKKKKIYFVKTCGGRRVYLRCRDFHVWVFLLSLACPSCHWLAFSLSWAFYVLVKHLQRIWMSFDLHLASNYISLLTYEQLPKRHSAFPQHVRAHPPSPKTCPKFKVRMKQDICQIYFIQSKRARWVQSKWRDTQPPSLPSENSKSHCGHPLAAICLGVYLYTAYTSSLYQVKTFRNYPKKLENYNDQTLQRR